MAKGMSRGKGEELVPFLQSTEGIVCATTRSQRPWQKLNSKFFSHSIWHPRQKCFSMGWDSVPIQWYPQSIRLVRAGIFVYFFFHHSILLPRIAPITYQVVE